jgi:hypothetical protein
MIVVALDPEIDTIAGGQGPDLVIVKGGGHVIVIMTGIDHAPGRMTMTEGDLVRGLENQSSAHETFIIPCTIIHWLYHHHYFFVYSLLITCPFFLFTMFTAK